MFKHFTCYVIFCRLKSNIALQIDSRIYSQSFPTTLVIQDDFFTQVCRNHKPLSEKREISLKKKKNITDIVIIFLQYGFTYTGLLLWGLTDPVTYEKRLWSGNSSLINPYN
jgi:hypothetical protein